MKTLDYILGMLDGAASAVATYGAAAGPVGASAAGAAAVADYFFQIAQKAVQAHEAATGKPMDLTTLQHIAPVA